MPRPFALDASAAAALAPPGTYAQTVGAALDDLARPPGGWRATYPQLAAYKWNLFDYAAEDATTR